MKVFDENFNYITESDENKRKNYESYLLGLSDNDLCLLLSTEVKNSDLKITKYDRSIIADIMCDIKFGKEDRFNG